MENRDLRKFHGLSDQQSGVLVGKVIPDSSAWGHLSEGDVLAIMDGKRIANNGTVQFRGTERLDLSYVVSQHQMGENIEVEVIRGGKPMKVTIPLKPPQKLVTGPTYDRQPTYYINSGLVVVPLTSGYIDAFEKGDPRFQTYRDHDLPSDRKKQVVIIARVLAHAINEGYHGLRNVVVSRINGQIISTIADVVEALTKPTVKDNNQYNVIEVDQDSASARTIVLDASLAAKRATIEILERYNIAKPASPDLMTSEQKQATTR